MERLLIAVCALLLLASTALADGLPTYFRFSETAFAGMYAVKQGSPSIGSAKGPMKR